MKYAVIVEEVQISFGAHVPDLPGCVAVGDTKTEVLRLDPGSKTVSYRRFERGWRASSGTIIECRAR